MSTSSSAVLTALGRALSSQFESKMLTLLFAPLFGSLLLWGAIAWFAWSPLTAWLDHVFLSVAWFRSVTAWFATIGFGGASRFLANLVALLFFIPLVFVCAVAAISVMAMPVVVRYLEKTHYPNLERKGEKVVLASATNTLTTLVIFLIGYLVTIPLWFIPPLILVVPWLWWGWLNQRLMRFDSLVEHAQEDERHDIVKSRKSGYRLLGLVVAAFNFIPPLFFVAPVFGALAFAHFSLAQLSKTRAA
jgi:hypothetical protein